jgi:hypothetical protein
MQRLCCPLQVVHERVSAGIGSDSDHRPDTQVFGSRQRWQDIRHIRREQAIHVADRQTRVLKSGMYRKPKQVEVRISRRRSDSG